MICDPLTKHGMEQCSNRLVDTMETGILDLVAAASSELKKMRARKARLDRTRKTGPTGDSVRSYIYDL